MPSVLRYAVRQLLKSPGFTLVAILGLALGIGANVALFSVVNSVLLRPLPYHDPDRLVRLSSTNEENNLTRVGFSYPRYLEVQQRQAVFSDLALSAGNAFTLTGRGDPEQLIGLQASATLLPTLGLEPLVGRNFSADEDRPGGERVALISHAHVAAALQPRSVDPRTGAHARRCAVHHHRRVARGGDGVPLEQLQIWVARPAEVPFLAPSQLNNGGYFFQAIARLRPGVSLPQAREAMNVIAAGYRTANPANVDAPSQIELIPLLDDAVGAQRQSYLLLFGAVGCVLLIACANIANLLLARFAARRREIASRFALGASRAEVVRQLVTESMLLAVLGGGVGLLLAEWALSALVTFGADLIPRVAEIRIDPNRAGLFAPRDPPHRSGDRPAARIAGVGRERAGSAQGSGPRLGRIGPASSRQPAGGRSVAIAGVAHRRRLAVDQLRESSARGARLRACGRVHRATGAAAATLPAREARRLL